MGTAQRDGERIEAGRVQSRLGVVVVVSEDGEGCGGEGGGEGGGGDVS